MTAFGGYIGFEARPPGGIENRFAAALEAPLVGTARSWRSSEAVLVCRQRVLSPEDRFEAQPTRGLGGAVSLFDGRLDNRQALIEALRIASPTAGVADGLIVARAYDEWGMDAPAHLLGEFALAVWDGAQRRLLLARDHTVSRQLLYLQGPGFLAFATNYKALLTLAPHPRAIDELALADLLMRSPDASARTIYKDIRWVQPSRRLVFTPVGVDTQKLWTPAFREPSRLSDDETVEAGRAVLESAVRARLRLDGPILSTATGGLDSSAISATAAKLAFPGSVRAFTMTPQPGSCPKMPEGQYADERSLVRRLLGRATNLRLEELQCVDPQPFELDPTWWFDRTGIAIRDPAHLSWFMPMFQRAADLGSGVILDGGWGNLTLSYHGLHYLNILRKEQRHLALWRTVFRLRGTLARPRWRSLVREYARPYIPLSARRDGGGQSDKWLRRSFLGSDRVAGVDLSGRRWTENINPVRVLRSADRPGMLNHYIERSRLQADVASGVRAITGVILSDPFQDRRVIEFALSLPPEQYIKGGVARSLARRLYADRLPIEILENRDRGAQNVDWFARLGPHRGRFVEMAETLHEAGTGGLLDSARLLALARNWPVATPEFRDENHDHPVFMSNALHAGYFKRWVDGRNR